PLPVRSIKTLKIIAYLAAPLITKLPFELFYPTGDKQDRLLHNKYNTYYEEADIIAGDFHFIRSYIPAKLDGKIIITNTVTPENVADLEDRGAKMLITTTSEFNNRSFGTNVMEGVLVALSEKKLSDLTSGDYLKLLDKIGFSPRVVKFRVGGYENE
ncbi:MAG: quinate 5-dehydrogenase, partial [Halanaerobiaceae bacterium]